MFIPDQVREEINAGALFVVNHSGGKDSQAMFLKLRRLVPASQILVIHAHLSGVEWPGTLDHIKATIGPAQLIVTSARKTFFEMVEHRGKWPSASYRQCTSDLKRGPIEKEIRRHLKANPQYKNRVVNCMGLRAEESTSRAKKDTFKKSARNSKAGRSWFDWLPIHEMTTPQVFAAIAGAGQVPHWAYSAGMTRLSCCFCIMSSRADLETAARLVPDLFMEYNALERRIDHTFIQPAKNKARRFLDEIVSPCQKIAA